MRPFYADELRPSRRLRPIHIYRLSVRPRPTRILSGARHGVTHVPLLVLLAGSALSELSALGFCAGGGGPGGAAIQAANIGPASEDNIDVSADGVVFGFCDVGLFNRFYLTSHDVPLLLLQLFVVGENSINRLGEIGLLVADGR